MGKTQSKPERPEVDLLRKRENKRKKKIKLRKNKRTFISTKDAETITDISQPAIETRLERQTIIHNEDKNDIIQSKEPTPTEVEPKKDPMEFVLGISLLELRRLLEEQERIDPDGQPDQNNGGNGEEAEETEEGEAREICQWMELRVHGN